MVASKRDVDGYLEAPPILSNERKGPGKLFRVYRDVKLPIYVGIIVNHYKDHYYPTSIQWKVFEFFFRGSMDFPMNEIFRFCFTFWKPPKKGELGTS